ncbi:hypothetical protein WR25_19463 isoform C [Diploscapter pachys]|uniref:ABC-type glutathione-S-conjugate transporter n=1 Tax=Diploscapter pachys TaxID=2018661 RepID=A0A2A2KL35_9BILA|nr:hypothetical protein WR25_19463 isoform A [Diploscapter pachys]PAV74682.1 hypothetical protein WR25_19463 isoform B [Diploscapter pachys]PAV74683.1 hypothetical protein WR25_19463 isoform C [Diploscapter pachys]
MEMEHLTDGNWNWLCEDEKLNNQSFQIESTNVPVCMQDTDTSKLAPGFLFYYALLIIYCLLLCFADARYDSEKNADDLFELSLGQTTPYLTEKWEKVWDPKLLEYQQKIKGNDEESEVSLPSIVFSLFQMFKNEILFTATLKLFTDNLQFASPYLLKKLIDFVSDANAPFWNGILFAVLMFSCSEIRSLILNSYYYILFRMSIKIQTTLTSAVYKKTLSLSNSARRAKTVGEIVNLMSIDVEKLQSITQQIHQFWSCPYQMIFALVYLFVTLGYSALPGIFIMIIFIPLNIFSSVIVKKWQMEQMKLKDERIKMVNEVLNGIKVIKLYAWEIPMEQHIEGVRQKELALIKKSSIVRNIIDSFNACSPFLVAIFSFGTYVMTSKSNELTPQVAFVSLTLFNQLRSPMNTIASLISQTVQALVSNKRLKEFLVADELDTSTVERTHFNDSTEATRIVDLRSTWDDTEETKCTLKDVNISADKGQLIAVVGKVGAGKSSLLNALLGEMSKLSGHIATNGDIAYVPQQPWIQNMSILSACALKPDLKILPSGDMTEIGEKGINLSGGQKARISLARAVYQNLDVYLLDDPLSAVDAHVGRHIFEKVIGTSGILRNKTRILVTHGLVYTQKTDQIVVLDEGRISEMGSFNELMNRKGKFREFYEEYNNKKRNEEDESGADLLDDTEDIDDNFKSDTKNLMSEPQISVLSTLSDDGSLIEDQSKGKLIKQEVIAEGHVKMSVYNNYIKAGTYCLFLTYGSFLLGHMIFQVLRNFWLSAWSDDYNPKIYNAASNDTLRMSTSFRLGTYGLLGVIESSCFLVSLIILVYACLNASRNLHKPLIHNLLRSPMSFFDTTPLGRILNRCAKDIEVIDASLPLNCRHLITCILQLIFTLIVIIISTPIFVLVIFPLGFLYMIILVSHIFRKVTKNCSLQRFFVPTLRQLRRLESVHRSPIYSHFGETIQGATSIRAYNRVTEFREQSGSIVDAFVKYRTSIMVANRWMAIRLEFVGNCVIFFAALFAVLSKEFDWVESPGIVGVAITYSLSITEILNFAVRQIGETESNIVAVERVREYTTTPNEAEWLLEDSRPPGDWPSKGEVHFSNYSTRYREDLDLVLKNITTDIRAAEKIGIVGRTGAGKSSFALGLFRMIEPASGTIWIDEIDIAKIGLHDLRSKITIIPQDPVLFSGTLRFNLDPFQRCDDKQIFEALELAHLKTFVDSLPSGLEYKISEGGENIRLELSLVTNVQL